MTEITVQFSDHEIAVIDALCITTDLSRTALLRHALRLYQYIYVKQAEGGTLAFTDAAGNVIKDEVFGCGPLE